MHVISRKKLKEAATRHAELEDHWTRGFASQRRRLGRIYRTFEGHLSSADAVGKWTVFNIKGNQYRLIAEINYLYGRLYIRHVLTHSEYSRGGWKR